MPPASLSATIVMMPGPSTASRISPRRLNRLSQWMLLLIQYMPESSSRGISYFHDASKPASWQNRNTLEVADSQGTW